ncbi:MAG TPA: alpha/beta hydrolase [Gemmatimonadales bacterium]|nr:alpha/beta hydrolase [Gemmatimonadales bacterium]
MTEFVTSADGTRIAYEEVGEGPRVVVIGGLFCDRQRMDDLAGHLAEAFTVLNYDRRGRGESGDTGPYAVEREIDDLAALIGAAGGSAMVYGHSSGAGLALRAAASGLPISRLVLHEPPYGQDDEESRASAQSLAERVRAAIESDRHGDAIADFLSAIGLPTDMVGALRQNPAMLAVARTMPYDFEVMGDFTGGTIPEHFVRAVSIPTLVIAGGVSPDFFRSTAERIAKLLPHGSLAVLDGHDHDAPGEVVAPVVAEFLAAAVDEDRRGRPDLFIHSNLPA